jgi:hypothetical protein
MTTPDHINWHATAHIDKFSPDQTRYAEAWLAEHAGCCALRVPVYPDRLDHLVLAQLFPDGPEDGTADADENLLVNGGLNVMTELLIGTALTGSVLSNTYGFVGAGAGVTAATTSDTALTDDGGSAFYQGFNATYPSQSGGVVTAVATFGSGSANFAWNEWCYGSSTVAVSTSTSATMASLTSGAETMWNHKVASLGTKVSGASWVFTATITWA